MPNVPRRPVFLNLLRIRLPVMGVVSILHRVSGAMLFLALPVSIWLLDTSLRDADGFRQVADQLGGSLRFLLPFVVWALAHHTLAGVRVLLLDIDRGAELAAARGSALAVIAGGATAALAAAVALL